MVDQPNNRRLAGHVLEAFDVIADDAVARADVLDDLVEGVVPVFIQAFEGVFDVALGTHPGHNFLVGDEFHRFGGREKSYRLLRLQIEASQRRK